jgi:hypothetical protein
MHANQVGLIRVRTHTHQAARLLVSRGAFVLTLAPGDSGPTHVRASEATARILLSANPGSARHQIRISVRAGHKKMGQGCLDPH